MKHLAVIIAMAFLVTAVPTIILQAQVDGNNDGCVDLQDFAIMQNLFTGPGCAPWEIVSFYAEGTEELILVPEVPGTHGLVLTDIISQRSSPITTITLIEGFNEQEETKLCIAIGVSETQNSGGYDRSYHLNSGIPFAAGATIKAQINNSGFTRITLCGYTY